MSNETANYLGISVAQWRQTLKSNDAVERRLAAHALGEIGPAASAAVPDLQAALKDPQTYVRVWAAAGLARIAPTCDEPLAVLLSGLNDEKSFVRSLAVWHLGRLCAGIPQIALATERLRAATADQNPSVRSEALLALRRLEGKGAPPPELHSLSRE